MLEIISNFDKWLFHIINSGISNPLFDKFFPYITQNSNWFLVWLLLFALIIYHKKKEGVVIVVALAVAVALSDFVSSKIIKEFFARPRPCHTLTGINLLIECGSGKSFPSSHAVNNFAAALFLIRFYPKFRCVFLIIAFLIAFSRVYVGVHYPIDVLAGGLFGTFTGFISALLCSKVLSAMSKNNQ